MENTKAKVETGWTPVGPIRNSNEEMIGVKFENGESLMISHWDHKVIGTFDNVSIKLPKNNGKNYLKKIALHASLNSKGELVEIPTYWRYGIKVAKKLVTRTFRGKDLPFGEWVKARAEICRATNSKTGEEKIIVNFIVGKENEKKNPVAIKFGGKERKETIFSVSIPGTEEKIVVNPIKRK
jgi:hypothetical protein